MLRGTQESLGVRRGSAVRHGLEAKRPFVEKLRAEWRLMKASMERQIVLFDPPVSLRVHSNGKDVTQEIREYVLQGLLDHNKLLKLCDTKDDNAPGPAGRVNGETGNPPARPRHGQARSPGRGLKGKAEAEA